MIGRKQAKDLYFTNDHEWINYQGSVAQVGICHFKLKGIKDIQRISFGETGSNYNSGEVIASIFYDDYRIDVNMPVNGRLISINEHLINGDSSILLENAEGSGWIALVAPAQPYERKGLMLPIQYRNMSANKYLK
jgi:glycine cleavage system H protein